MADHATLSKLSNYELLLATLDGRLVDLARMFSSGTFYNLPTGAIRFNLPAGRFETWSGTDWNAALTQLQIDLAGGRKVLHNGSEPALTVTQTGSGSAIRVEDSASVDATPFDIDTNGRMGLGSVANSAANIFMALPITGDSVSYGMRITSTVAADVTSQASVYETRPAVINQSFTLNSLRHFQAAQGSFGALATVTSQIAFFVSSTLVSAQNNYGVYSDLMPGPGNWSIYAARTTDNYLAGDLRIGKVFTKRQSAVTKNATVVLSATEIAEQGIVVSSPSSSINLTLPAGEFVDDVFVNAQFTSQTFEWSIINTGSAPITLLANTGHTITGSASIAGGVSGRFATRRSGVDSYQTFRIS